MGFEFLADFMSAAKPERGGGDETRDGGDDGGEGGDGKGGNAWRGPQSVQSVPNGQSAC